MINEEPQVLGLRPKELQPARHLDWQDLLFLSSQNWGLRHRSPVGKAVLELKNGIKNGDAVSISAPQNFIPASLLPQEVNIGGQVLPLHDIDNYLTPEARQKTLADFQAAIQNFITSSIGIDAHNIQIEAITVEKFIQELRRNSAFLVAKFEFADMPVDLTDYFGLGKCGANRQDIKPDDIFALLHLKHITVADLSSNLTSSLTPEIYEKIKSLATGMIWTKLCTTVKEKGILLNKIL